MMQSISFRLIKKLNKIIIKWNKIIIKCNSIIIEKIIRTRDMPIKIKYT